MQDNAQEEIARRSESSTRLEEQYGSDEEISKSHAIRNSRRVARAQKYTDQEEKIVLKKLDSRLTLFLAFLYLLSFLDRSSNGSFWRMWLLADRE